MLCIPFRSLVGEVPDTGMPRLNDVAARTIMMAKTDMMDFIWTEGGPYCASEFEVS